MRYESGYKAETRQRILSAAARAMRVGGASAVGIASVMAGAGLTHGAFYAHFSSRDNLVDETVKAMAQEACDRFDAVTGSLSPADAMRAYVDFYLSEAHRDALVRSCPLPWISSEVQRLGEESRRCHGAALASLTNLVAFRLAALELPAPEAMASVILAALIGAIVLARAVGDAHQSALILERARDDTLKRLGLGRR